MCFWVEVGGGGGRLRSVVFLGIIPRMKKTCPVCTEAVEYDERVKFCPEHGLPLRAPIAYYDGFISYRRNGGSELATIISTLLGMSFGKNLFLDVDRLGAERFDERLLECIAAAPNFLLILTPGGLDRCRNEGDWLRREIEQALRCEKKIISIMKEGLFFRPPRVCRRCCGACPTCTVCGPVAQ